MAELIGPTKSLRIQCPNCTAPPRYFKYLGWAMLSDRKAFTCTKCGYDWSEK